MVLHIFLLCAITVCVAWNWYSRRRPTDPPELPLGVPYFGILPSLMVCDSIRLYKFMENFYEVAEKIGGVYQMHMGGVKLYGVSHPEDCATVLSESNHKYYIYDFLKQVVGDGLLTAEFSTWKKNRKLLNPAFNHQVLDSFIEIFNQSGQSLLKKFARNEGKLFNPDGDIRLSTLETICATSFGTEVEDKRILNEYLPKLEEIERLLVKRMLKVWYHLNFFYQFSSLKKRLDQLVGWMDDFSNAIIDKKKSELKNPDYNENNNSGKIKPFIYILMDLHQEGKSMSEEQIRWETTTILIGGHETSASTLTIALMVLGSHPDVQEKAYREIQEVLGDSNTVSKEALSKLEYVEAVVKEVLRLYPVAPIIARKLDRDIKLKKYTLKAGYGCVISVYGAGRHRAWGADARTFRPERWLEKDKLPPSKYFTAFGLGRRSCIGKTYGMMSMKITLAHVIKNFEIFSDITKMVLKVDIFTSPLNAEVTLKRRQ